MNRIRFAVMLVVAVAMSSSVFAALSPKLADWAKGPEQWLLTKDEARAWKNVKTDEEAQAFIDLFWARRDPTPGTFRNEFRENFDSRVAYTDENYKSEKGKRGALTDPGRVYILLGPPRVAGNQGKTSMGLMDSGGGSAPVAAASTGGGPVGIAEGPNLMRGSMSAKMVWEYPRPAELGLMGNVVFIQDQISFEFHYDPQQGNVVGAMKAAIEKAVVNKDLTSVPEWAIPPHFEIKQAEPAEVSTVTVETKEAAPGTTVIKRGGKTVETVVAVAGSPGAHDLSLIADSRAVKPQEDSPFGNVKKQSTFKKADDIGFMFQYCRPQVDTVRTTLKFAILLSGKVGKDEVDIEVPEDESTAEPVRTMPGCSIVRGSIPGGSLQPGAYSFTIRVTDPATSQSYNLAQDFKVE